jgi:hypothetical protein
MYRNTSRPTSDVAWAIQSPAQLEEVLDTATEGVTVIRLDAETMRTLRLLLEEMWADHPAHKAG